MGAKDSKPSFISYDDAVKRVSDSELRCIREAFKKCAGSNGTSLSLQAFVHEVLCDAVPYEVAEWLYQVCGGTKRGISFKDLLCGIVVLTKGNIEEKIKFLWSLYVNNQNDNGTYIYKRDFTRALHIENNSLPVSESHRSAEILTGLFGVNEKITFDQFRSWFLIHKNATVLSRWLLTDHAHSNQELDTPTFYQSLAGVTHLEEKDIIELEKCFWSLRSGAPSGQLDAASFTPLLSPPYPEEAVHGVFQAFDENRDGHIDFKELCCGISAACRGPITERLKFCFKIFDVDGDGVVRGGELATMARVLAAAANEERCLDVADHGLTRTHYQPEMILLELQDKLVSAPEGAAKPQFKLGPMDDHEQITTLSKCISNEVESPTSSLDSLIGPELALTQAEFLVWGVGPAAPLLAPMLGLAQLLCHVVLGLRPPCPHIEREIVLGWLRRAEGRGLCVGQFWYLVDAAWWRSWTHYTDLAAPAHSDTECLSSLTYRAECSSVSSGGSSGVGSSLPVVPPPPCIDNSALLDPQARNSRVGTLTGEGGLVRRDVTLAQHRDFELLPAALWRPLAAWYTHAHALPRQVIRPSNSDVELELYPLQLEIWRHLPGVQRATGMYGVGGVGGVGVAAYSSSLAGPPPPARYLAYTAAFSRLATVKQVSEFVCGALSLSRESSRLWLLEDAACPPGAGVVLDDDRLTLEALGLKHGSKILLEKRSPDLTWPEELAALRGRGVRTERRATLAAPELPGATGLHNLGNTCYMNAALQAVWNTGPLTRYFNTGTYLYEVNTTNPLGTRGQLALTYGQLCKEVWSGGGGSVAPLRVRLAVSRWARHLAGGQQHDAQELLAWLLDALHEDLRRHHRDTPTPSEQETWQQYLLRNDSIISDLFYGLLWSRVRCSVCGLDSVKREPFNILSVPLPIDTDIRRYALVIPADGSIPTKYGVTVAGDATVYLLKEKLYQLTGMTPDTLLVTEVSGPLVRRVFAEEVKVSAVCTELHVYQLPDLQHHDDQLHVMASDECSCDSGVCVGGAAEVSGGGSLCMPALFCFQRSSSQLAMSASPPRSSVLQPRSSTLPRDLAHYHRTNSRGSPTPSVRSLNLNYTPKMNSFGGSTSNLNQVNDRQDMKMPKIQYLIAVHRKQSRGEASFLWAGGGAALFGQPLVVAAQHGGSGRALYRRVLARLAALLTSPPSRANPNHAHDCDDSLGYEFPFTLRAVNATGAWCAVCPWQAACRGCSLPATDLPLLSTLPKPRCSISGDACRVHGLQNGRIYDDTSQNMRGRELQELDLYSLRRQRREVMLAIDWEPTALHLRYQTAKEKTCVVDASVGVVAAASSSGVSLASCLAAFVAEETLDAMYRCRRCAAPMPATKLLRLYRAPPVMIIHLKRFQYVNNKWIKSTKPVSFPLEDFDPTEYLATVPQETIYRHNELNNKTGDRCSDEDEHSVSDDDASCTSNDALKTNPKERRRKENGKRERLISQTLLADPVNDDNLEDYHQHHLKPGCDAFDLKYRLYAIVSHSGQLSGGHYVSCVRHSSGRWLCYNDSSCTLLAAPPPAPPADPAAAYLLFYQRRHLDIDKYLPDVTGKTAVSETDSLDADENDLRKMCVIT